MGQCGILKLLIFGATRVIPSGVRKDRGGSLSLADKAPLGNAQ